jgi:NAD kinase
MMIDGQIWFRVKKGEEIEIKKAVHKVRMLKFPGYSFYSVLRQKLHWGVLPGQPL